MAMYREWAELPNRINSEIPRARFNLKHIQNELISYRLTLLTYNFIATNVDKEVWDAYRGVVKEIRRLEAETKKRSLIFRSPSQLRNLYEGWETLVSKQVSFVSDIEKIPERLAFYDKMETHKESTQRSRKEEETNTQKYTKAVQGLEAAREYVERFNRENDISVFGASALRFEDAQQFWDERMSYIHELEASKADLDKIIAEMDSLKKIMYEAPALARWIHEVEQKFTRLSYDHDLLVNSYGKAVIAETEMNEMRSLMNELIPRLWAAGQREQLEHYVKTIEGFLQIYESEVDSEIDFAERHTSRRQRDERVTKEQDKSQLIDLTKLLISAVEAREPHMVNHSLTVARLAVDTAKQLNWTAEEQHNLEIAALLHDVGKLWIPESILNKAGDLDDDEMDQIHKHTPYGAQILETFDSFRDIVPWIYYHHERWDGSGYPEGLRGDDIPIAARIISVAEAYSAMTSGSHSRKAMTSDAAQAQIQSEAGTAFDPQVVEAFVKAMQMPRKGMF